MLVELYWMPNFKIKVVMILAWRLIPLYQMFTSLPLNFLVSTLIGCEVSECTFGNESTNLI